MPDLSLREDLESAKHASSSSGECLCQWCQALAVAQAKADAHERELVARIEAMRMKLPGVLTERGAGYNDAICDVLISISAPLRPTNTEKPETSAIECDASDTTPRDKWRTLCDNCYHDIHKACDGGHECTCLCRIPGSKPSDERKPRDERPARDKVASWSADKRNGDEPSYVLAIVESIDALADRFALLAERLGGK